MGGEARVRPRKVGLDEAPEPKVKSLCREASQHGCSVASPECLQPLLMIDPLER